MPTTVFTSSGTFQRQPGVTKATVKCIGGGGGGSDQTGGGNQGRGGGGGGGCGVELLTGLIAASYSITVGTGDPGGFHDPATFGGDSYFDDGSQVKGIGGQSFDDNHQLPGTGGSAVGTTTHTGGDGDVNSGNDGGGGGGGGGPTGNGSNASGSIGGTGGSGSPAGGNGGDGGVGGDGNNGSAPGGGGGGISSVGTSAGNGADGEVDIDYTLGSLSAIASPANANSGDTLTTSTVRMLDQDASPDTHADTAGAGNTCTATLTVVSGSGVLSGTTTRAYGTGADGSKADFTDLVVTGAGTFKITWTDDATGVTVDSSSFTITGAATTTQPYYFLHLAGGQS